MIKTRTLAGLGAVLNENVSHLTASTGSFLSLPGLVSDASVTASIGDLLDRLCLSMTMGKPVGLAMWARRESGRFGRATCLDLTAAATRAITLASSEAEVERQRVLDFMDILTLEVERSAINDRAFRPPAPIEERALPALLAMLAERDSGLCCHSKATAEWTRRLAKAMHLSDESVEFISLCALLHDVGKIATPDRILFKEGPLSEDEWVLMREHPAAGQRILDQIPSLQRCAVVVRAHHERFDGAGYPDGLVGISIPFEARVLAVADAFHAMISERPYRLPIAPREALEIIADGRGTQWDPEVVDAMLGMFKHQSSSATRVGSKVSSA